MKRAIVTGATGFVGRTMVRRLLEAGVDVTTVGRSSAVASPDCRHFSFGAGEWTGDQWRAAFEAAKPDVIFHLAGKFRGSPEDLHAVNVSLLQSLIGALDGMETPPTLIVAGSAAEYGRAFVDGEPTVESTPCQPVPGTYGETKVLQTELVLEFGKRTGSRAIVARIFNTIGPGMPSTLALGDFATQIAAMDSDGGVLRTGNLDVCRDLIEVQDVATILCRLAENPEADGIINVCSGEAFNLQALVEHMIKRSRKSIRIEVDPARLRPGEVRVIIGSIARLKSLGITPAPLDILAVVDAMMDYSTAKAAADQGAAAMAAAK